MTTADQLDVFLLVCFPLRGIRENGKEEDEKEKKRGWLYCDVMMMRCNVVM